jgi:copper chaperone CopZ
MNKIFQVVSLLSLLALSGIGLASCQSKSSAATTQQATEQSAVINIPTAKCSSCAKHIKKAVTSLDGVTGISVNTDAHTAEVKYIPTKTNVGAIETAISKSGYTADKVERDSVAYAGLDECCK